MCRPPGVMFRNRPPFGADRVVIARTVANVTKKDAVDISWRSLRRLWKHLWYSARMSRSGESRERCPACDGAAVGA